MGTLGRVVVENGMVSSEISGRRTSHITLFISDERRKVIVLGFENLPQYLNGLTLDVD